MYSWVAFPLLRISLVFSLGIVTAIRFPTLSQEYSILLLGIAFGLYLFFYFFLKEKRFFSLNLLFGVLCQVMIFLAGYCCLLANDEKTYDDHLLNTEKIEAYQGTIISEPEEKPNSLRYLIKVNSVQTASSWNTASGNLLLYVKKDTLAIRYHYGDRILISGNPELIHSPKNTGEFDYKKYLSYQQIHHQDFVQNYEVILLSTYEGFSLLSLSIKARQYLKSIITNSISAKRERAIALALVLGTKTEITPEINEAYSSAGVMHVLAVSGLHVGILYMIMSWFFKWGKSHKHLKWVILILSLSVLWAYAFITGLSPSVMRAATMFSFLLVAEVISRDYNIFNTLAAAGMVLLCYNPYMIMYVGFQLSFIAVFGIAYMTPRFEKLIYIENKNLKKIWLTICGSVAAQIATMPISIYFFHKVPTYSLLTNLLAIPGAGFILGGGIFLFFCSGIPYLSTLIGFLLNGIIFFFNEFVFFIEKVPFSSINDILIDEYQAWSIVISILLFFIWRYTRNFSFFKLACFSILFFFFIQYRRIWDNYDNTKLSIYSIENHSAIDIFDKGTTYSFVDSILQKDTKKIDFHIKPNRLINSITNATDQIHCSYLDGKNKLIVFKGVKIGIIQDLQLFDNMELDLAILTRLSNLENEQLTSLTNNATHLFVNGRQKPWIRMRINELKNQQSINCQVIIDRSLSINI